MNAVIQHYENYKREIGVMKNAMREQAGVDPVADTPSQRRRYNPQTGKIE
ncbi:MAG: hypothetical protein HC808_10120 [Candidatus Competibacteraceae bacterium]|nr:hypothetical protein [Candidatus Competibacteraceae bacterium]